MAHASRLVSGSQIARMRFAGVDLTGVYGDLLGDPPPDVYVLVKGPAGSGKSTFTLGLADTWADEVAPALYVAAEEGISKSLRDRAVRIGANSPKLHFSTFEGFDAVLADARTVKAGLVVLDSITSADPHSRHFAAFAKAVHAAGLALVLVAHETKKGTHRGSSSLAYDPAIVVRVRGGVAETEKNRHAPLTAVDVYFGAADRRANPAPTGTAAGACDCAACGTCGGVVRSNPPHSGACAHATGDACSCSCNGRLHRSGITTTVGRVKTHGKQSSAGRAAMAGMTAGGTKKVVGGAKVVRRGAGTRANPVPVPFGVTFSQIAKTHAVKGAAKLNKLVGFESPALIDFAADADKLPKGEREETMAERTDRAQMAFSWKSRSRATEDGLGRPMREKRGILTVVVFTESTDPDLFTDPAGVSHESPWSRDGRVYEFAGADFETAYKRFLGVFGTTRVAVYDQFHAKLVLGAAEYRRQEKAGAPAKASRSSAPRKPRVTVKPAAVAKATRVKPPAPKPAARKPAPRPAKQPTARPSSQSQGVGDLAAFDSGMASLENLLAKAIQ